MNQYFFEDLTLGRRESLSRNVSAALIEAFAEVSGDNNALHLDAGYAATTRFKERIAHGALLSSFVSAVLGTVMPGLGTVYLSQTVKFLAPVKIGDTVQTTAEVIGRDEVKNKVTLRTCCHVGDMMVVDGEAIVYVPSRSSVM
ncbi:MAG: MaoC family dehydratase [Kordiimonas sp.]